MNDTRKSVAKPADESAIGRPAGQVGLPTRLLGVWAHPDDEAYLAAGLMSRVAAAGGAVTLVVLTDGELGFAEQDRRSRAERSAQRRSEMLDAMGVIGVTDVRFIGIGDGDVRAVPVAELAAGLSDTIRGARPELITTFGPDGVTGHQDHVAASVATTRAWLETDIGDLWYAAKTTRWLDDWRSIHDDLGIWMTAEPSGYEPGDLAAVVRLSEDELNTKRRVLAGHCSQTEGVARVFGESAYREWICEESFRRPTDHEMFAIDPTASVASRCHRSGRGVWNDAQPSDHAVVVAPDGCTKYRESIAPQREFSR